MAHLTSLRGKPLGENLDAHEIIPGLFVGSAPPFDRVLPIGALALCAQEIQPARDRLIYRGNLLRARLNDANPIPAAQIASAVGTARMVAEEVRRRERVLVTCAAGLNRSALVAALAIRMLRPKMRPLDVVILLRHRRDVNALFNPFFEELVKTLPVS